MELLIFTGKLFVFLIFFVLVLLVILVFISIFKAKSQNRLDLKIDEFHEDWFLVESDLVKTLIKNKDLSKSAYKLLKEKQKKLKEISKKIFVIDFDGDVKAHPVNSLREEISAILLIANPEQDEVVLRLESPGGIVSSYGLAASELVRLREKNIKLTICIDKVAASGGYLMACVANKILAAPFAIVGSIGVVAQVPNLHRLLQKWDVDYKQYTAGEYKRTVSLFGEVTPQGEKKFIEQIEATHDLFKRFVHTYRPHLDMAAISTGEYWYGQQALELKLVDQIQTSDDYLLELYQANNPIYKIHLPLKEKWSDKISQILSSSLHQAFLKVLSSLNRWPYA